jgi:hypothetical protein
MVLIAVTIDLAHAGEIVTLQGKDESGKTFSMAFEYLDTNTSRLNVSQQRDNGYLLVRNGKAYNVGQHDGEWMVIDMAQLGKLASALGQDPSLGLEHGSQVIQMSRTGRSERVAGIKGDVYALKWRDHTGKTRNDDLVLSKDRRVIAFTTAWTRAMETIRRSFTDTPPAKDDLMVRIGGKKDRGILRLGHEIVIASIEPTPNEPSRFELPAQVTQMPDMGAIMKGSGAAQSEGKEGGLFRGFFGNKADRQTQRVDEKTDQETDNAVDRTINKVFDGLFGK